MLTIANVCECSFNNSDRTLVMARPDLLQLSVTKNDIFELHIFYIPRNVWLGTITNARGDRFYWMIDLASQQSL